VDIVLDLMPPPPFASAVMACFCVYGVSAPAELNAQLARTMLLAGRT